MPKIRKHSSKRKPLKLKYAIQKKVTMHNRKVRKTARKMKAQGLGPKRMKKDPGIPNIHPHKEEMMNALERKENMEKERKEQLLALAKADVQLPKGTIENYAQSIQAKVIKFEDEKNNNGGLTEEELREAQQLLDPNAKAMNQSKKAYMKELKKVLEAADVIIEVLDARDPEGCRSKDLEQQVVASGKKVLIVINKIDLVPPQNARMWQRYIRREYPCVLFKSNRQSQQDHLSSGTALHKQSLTNNTELVSQMMGTSKAIGSENLMNILKNYARVEGTGKAKQQIVVGVVGFPNVGKSSLINSLKRTKAAPTGNTPGITKSMQEIWLDKNIILLDSPGVVLSSKDQSDSLILRSAIKIEDVADPVRPVEALLGRIEKEEILKLYRIADFKTTEEFLGQVARKKGHLQSGGIPNFDMAARAVIRDYLNGKLKFFTAPPIMESDDIDEDMEVEQ